MDIGVLKPIGLAVTLLGIQYLWLRIVRRMQAVQLISNWSPDRHQAKDKTPTMGGVAIIVNTLILVTYFDLWSVKIIPFMMALLGFALIGAIDDIGAILKRGNEGLRPRAKAGLQLLLALSILLYWNMAVAPLAIWEWLIWAFLLVGSSNATNLTDGLDALLAGSMSISLMGMASLFYIRGDLYWVLVTGALGIAVLYFLSVNHHPAKQFMGDTGSLALGASLAVLAMAWGNFWVLLGIGFVYGIETLSVIIQVASFKKRGKRVFLMSPLHHHFELLGCSEWQVVFLFWTLGAIGTGLTVWGVLGAMA